MEQFSGKIRRGGFPLCFEKARLITESFKQTEGEPDITRHAKAYAYMLESIPLIISDDELFVGEGASKKWGAEIDPFLGVWREDEVRGAAQEGIISIEESDWPLFRELGQYWAKKCSEYSQSNLFDDRLYKYLQLGVTLPPMKRKDEFRGAYAGSGLCLSFAFTDCYTDFARWLNGLLPVITEAEDELKNLKYFSQDAVQKKLYLEAMTMVLKAVIKMANRYAEVAENLAEKENEPRRKTELKRIAAACRRVPANRPANFFEAMQSLWFNQILSSPTSTYNFGRFDQYMYPFFKMDRDKGLLSDEEVLALLSELRFKCMRPENIKLSSAKRSQHAGFAKWRNMTIGGVTPDGQDASNELTYLVLEAANRTRTSHHTITLRVHQDTPEKLMIKALEVVKTGIGMPALALDKSFIEYLTSGNIPIESARNYHLAGCVDPAIPGKASFLAGSFFVVPKVFEIFLNNGVDPRTGLEAGPFKPNVENFKSYNELSQAFKDFMADFISLSHEHSFLLKSFTGSYYDAVEILETAMVHDGIKIGQPLSKRKPVPPYDFRAQMVPVGAINVADSLAAIKTLVFDSQKISLKTLKQAIAANWEGFEDVRKLCLNAPKYGNDIADVDSIAKDLYEFIIAEEAKYLTPARPQGARIKGFGGASISSMFAGGAIIGATPDGRLAGTTLADGTVSPAQGRDTHGPTAMLRSAAKLDQSQCSSMLLNIKLHPSSLKTENDLKKLGSLIKTYSEIGGKWVQFNVVDNEQLLEAQKTPENYRDLIVRVAGYSAYFVDLGKGVQDDIVRRMEVCI
jgi:pyruvate formate-lyase/glycerol dehydratase family glycyl radical enzyme